MDAELILKLILKKEAKINVLEQQLTEKSGMVQKLSQENEKLAAVLYDLEGDQADIIGKLEWEKDELAGQLEQAEKEKTEIAKQLKVREVALKDLTRQVYALSKIIREKNEVAKTDSEVQTAQLTENRQSLEEDLKNELLEIVASLKKTMAQIQLDFKTLEAQKDLTIGVLSLQRDDLARELERVENDKKDLKQTLHYDQKSLVKLTTKYNAVKKELAAALDKIDDLRARNDDKRAKIDNFSMEKKKLEDVFEEIKRKNSELENDLAHQQIALKVAADDRDKAQVWLVEAQENISLLEKEYNYKVVELEEENSLLTDKLEAAEKDKKDNEGRIHLALDHELTEEEKTKRRACIEKHAKYLINKYAKINEEQARKIAEKAIQYLELTREFNEWQGEIVLKLRQPYNSQPVLHQAPWDALYR